MLILVESLRRSPEQQAWAAEIDDLFRQGGAEAHDHARATGWYIALLEHYSATTTENFGTLCWMGHSVVDSSRIARTLLPFLVMNMREECYEALVAAGAIRAYRP